MKATITSTDLIVTLSDTVQARVWEGTTESGVPFVAFIALCMVDNAEDAKEFDSELVVAKNPRIRMPKQGAEQ